LRDRRAEPSDQNACRTGLDRYHETITSRTGEAAMKVFGIGRPMRWFLIGLLVLLVWGAVAGYVVIGEFRRAQQEGVQRK
jgi:hypothetical protein